jgi:hypothetical protein
MSTPLLSYSAIVLMMGWSVAIAAWQIMQVFTLGRPAIGPLITLSWQYSVHVAPFELCTLCGKAIGCTAFGRTPKKSLTASAVVRCAGVNTAAGDAWS